MKGIQDFSKLLVSLENLTLRKLDGEGNTIEVEFALNKPATDEEVKDIEIKLGCKLPKEYVEFLKKYNGARIYDYEGLDGFIILGTHDIESTNRFAENTFEDDWKEDLLIFAKYIGESNYLAFESIDGDRESAVIDCFFEELPEDWKKISESFGDFLSNIVKNDGRKFWLNG